MWNTFVRIADLDIEFITKYSVKHICKGYMIEPTDEPDMTVTVSEQEIFDEMMAVDEAERVYPSYYETVCLYRNLCKQLWQYNGLILHAATFKVGDHTIAFTAKSGTGKTTHLRLWQELLEDKLQIVNGDKPIIRFFGDETPIAYGTPWCGKEHYGQNTSAPLTDICVIKRNTKNFVEKISKEEILDIIFNQTLLPDDAIGKTITMGLIDKLLSVCNLWVINCNMESEAAKVAYNAIIDNQGD